MVQTLTSRGIIHGRYLADTVKLKPYTVQITKGYPQVRAGNLFGTVTKLHKMATALGYLVSTCPFVTGTSFGRSYSSESSNIPLACFTVW